MRHTLFLSSGLAILWLINSGHYAGLILCLGVLSIALVMVIAHRMDAVDHQARAIEIKFRPSFYWLWLLKEVIVSNIDVVKRIWLSPESISPTVATIKISQKTEIGRVVYANSITLTPGTVALDLSDSDVTVHALTEQGLTALKQGEMDHRVTRMEK